MRVTTIVLHHSASPGGSVAQFRREHKARGFKDIGYHWVIGNGAGASNGEIQPGRPADQQGAGVYNNNAGKWHVCLVGNFHEKDALGRPCQPTAAQWESLGHLLESLASRCQKEHWGKPVLAGHKEVTLPGHGTACPGQYFPLGDVKQWFREQVTPDGRVAEVDLREWLEKKRKREQQDQAAVELAKKVIVPSTPTRVPLTVLVTRAFEEPPGKVFSLPCFIGTVPYSSDPPQPLVPLKALCHGVGWWLKEAKGKLEVTTALPKMETTEENPGDGR